MVNGCRLGISLRNSIVIIGDLRRIGEITPDVSPLEGHTRIRITGSSFTKDSQLLIDDIKADDISTLRGGTLLFATLPPRNEGFVNVIIKTSGTEDRIIKNGIKFVSDGENAAEAILRSTIVRLEELREQFEELENSSSLSDLDRDQIYFEANLAMTLSYEGIDKRLSELGNPDIDLNRVYSKHLKRQHEKYEVLRQRIIG